MYFGYNLEGSVVVNKQYMINKVELGSVNSNNRSPKNQTGTGKFIQHLQCSGNYTDGNPV